MREASPTMPPVDWWIDLGINFIFLSSVDLGMNVFWKCMKALILLHDFMKPAPESIK